MFNLTMNYYDMSAKDSIRNLRRFACYLLLGGFVSGVSAQTYRFDLSEGGKAKEDYIKILPSDRFSESRGYGYDFVTPKDLRPDTPRFFSVVVPDGNYRVTVTMGSDRYAAETTVRGESRRLFIENLPTRKGERITKSFIVNKRDSLISGNEKVIVKANERQKLNWDNRLTLEINGSRPAVSTIEITRDDSVPTVFLCGNSTVVDNDCEPYTSWGQMIPVFFDENVAIANYAESGLAADTFIGQKRLKKALSQMKPGDYVLVEFAHNDQKQKGPGKGAYYSFAYYIKQFIDEARAKGATPVLVTPTRRRFFDKEGHITDTHLNYPQVVKEIALRENVDLIDLQQMTKVMCEALGEEGSRKLFVHYPPNTYKNQPKELKDNTHFNTYGAYEVAKCVLEGMRYIGLPLVKHIRPEYSEAFSPVCPDDFESFKWVLSPFEVTDKPDGN